MSGPSGGSPDLLVAGAGVMGAWVALRARESGRSVELLDAYGIAHARASSGDETRITRAAHGDDRLYTRWSRHSLGEWRRLEEEHGVRLFVQSGVLWFAHGDDGFEARTAAVLDAEEVPYERLSPVEAAARWPVSADGLAWVLHEPAGGVLMARRGVRTVVERFTRSGGAFALEAVRPGRSDGRRLIDVVEGRGERRSADAFVFACGPWLRGLFPELLGNVLRVTKQDVILVGPPAGDDRFRADRDGPPMPAWCDYETAFYGVPAIDERGFKAAPDRLGAVFDPSHGERVVEAESIRLSRSYLRRRFPDLAAAPVVETRVCQYESTPDGHFLLAPHPDWDNVWLVGGGSGHGFKHGPRIGEYVVRRLDGAREGDQDGPDEARFGLGPRTPRHAARTGGDEMWRSWEPY